MKTKEYEWLAIEDIADEYPSEEEIKQAIDDGDWNIFKGCKYSYFDEEWVANEVFKDHCWELGWASEEGDFIFIVVREANSKEYSVCRVTLAYVMVPVVETIDFEEEIM